VDNNQAVDTLVVIDFGSQFSQTIIRKARELGVYSELKNPSITADELKDSNVKGMILSGSPKTIFDADAYQLDQEIYELGIPILGLAYGKDRILKDFGGNLSAVSSKQTNKAEVSVKGLEKLFKGLDQTFNAWVQTDSQVEDMPKGFESIADVNKQVNSFYNEEKQFIGLGFHPENPFTEAGDQIFKNFLLEMCGFDGKWTTASFVDKQVEIIREQIGDKKVLLGLSGGVDSSVAGVLLNQAISDQLVCIFVDHGLLRKNEVKDVMDSLSGKFGLNIIHVDASERFLSKLEGVEDPEEKRKIIGNEFIEVFNDEAQKLDQVDFLAQGTLYTDIIESGTETAETIKSHHNVGGLPEEMDFELVEPLNKLFKDEVRAVGEELGMPKSLVWRQPFPGPGLAIRCIGAVTKDKLAILREADAVVREEIAAAGLSKEIWQYFAVLPGFKSVGVSNDKRTYDYTIAIRAVNSIDGVTSEWAKIPLDILDQISTRMVNEVDQVNRVVYDITAKPPSTIEWE